MSFFVYLPGKYPLGIVFQSGLRKLEAVFRKSLDMYYFEDPEWPERLENGATAKVLWSKALSRLEVCID